MAPSRTADGARGYRIGRAGVLAQLPGRAQEAIAVYEADPDHPRAAATARWLDCPTTGARPGLQTSNAPAGTTAMPSARL
ncbi:MAG: hypothetical protein ACK5QW_03865 [Cyanobacteriota bacterium]